MKTNFDVYDNSISVSFLVKIQSGKVTDLNPRMDLISLPLLTNTRLCQQLIVSDNIIAALYDRFSVLRNK